MHAPQKLTAVHAKALQARLASRKQLRLQLLS